MYPFLDTQIDTLLGLINESNPGLVVQLTPAIMGSLVPTSVTPGTGQIQDTSLRLLVIQGNTADYIGYQTVYYRRINLTNMFRSMSLTLSDYIGSTTMTATQFCTAFNNKYGTELVPTDFSQTSFTSGTAATVTIASSSLCYSGSFKFTWTQGAPFMSQVITSPVLTGKLWPGGNTFAAGRLPQGDVLTYGLNCSSISTLLKGLASSTTITPANFTTANSVYANILAFLTANITSYTLTGSDQATVGGLGNLTFVRYTLPSSSVPGANPAYGFVTIVPALSTSWFQGQLYLHYN